MTCVRKRSGSSACRGLFLPSRGWSAMQRARRFCLRRAFSRTNQRCRRVRQWVSSRTRQNWSVCLAPLSAPYRKMPETTTASGGCPLFHSSLSRIRPWRNWGEAGRHPSNRRSLSRRPRNQRRSVKPTRKPTLCAIITTVNASSDARSSMTRTQGMIIIYRCLTHTGVEAVSG